ncbi:hypothetical protein AA303_04140 [Pseudomonas psychrophila]|nr:hypothetical protein AA303_04140 [Pseudomonas psychrophila]
MSSTKQFVRMCANSRLENKVLALIELSSMHGLMLTLSASRLKKQPIRTTIGLAASAYKD